MFLARIEKADPNDITIDEDNKGVGWGHYQFTAQSLTCSLVMKSWGDIGNTETACKLIAAAIRTCKVAQYICQKTNVKATTYISDMYLGRVIETLWDLWKLAGAVSLSCPKIVQVPILTSGILANHDNDFANKRTSACHPTPYIR